MSTTASARLMRLEAPHHHRVEEHVQVARHRGVRQHAPKALQRFGRHPHAQLRQVAPKEGAQKVQSPCQRSRFVGRQETQWEAACERRSGTASVRRCASISGRRASNSRGTNCTSSSTTRRSRCPAKNNSGCANTARSLSRSRSRNKACGCSAAMVRAKVVLPTWRGPRIATAGHRASHWRASASRRRFNIAAF